MWRAVMLVTVVMVMVLLCSIQCDCLSRNSNNKNNHHRSKDRSVDLPSTSSSSSSPSRGYSSPPHHSLPFDEFDESIFERFGLLTDPEHERTGSAIIHNYFISILPTCPTAYKLTLLQNTSSRNGGSDNKGKKTAHLRTGQYTLCKYHGTARLRALRECSGSTKSCGLTKNDYWITDVESFNASPPLSSSSTSSQSTELNGVGDNKEDSPESSTEMGEHCLPRKCSTKQLMAINMKNNMDCGSFYICIMGQHFLLHCPVGNQFSEEYGVCIEKKFANCKLSSLCKF